MHRQGFGFSFFLALFLFFRWIYVLDVSYYLPIKCYTFTVECCGMLPCHIIEKTMVCQLPPLLVLWCLFIKQLHFHTHTLIHFILYHVSLESCKNI